MKMSIEQQTQISETLNAWCDSDTQDLRGNHWRVVQQAYEKQGKAFSALQMRFRWDCFWAASQTLRRQPDFDLYENNTLNDTHVDTYLREYFKRNRKRMPKGYYAEK